MIKEFYDTTENRTVEKEFFDEPREFEDVREDWSRKRQESKKKERKNAGKIRKMAYLVASTVATVTIAQAAIPTMKSTLIPANEYAEIAYSNGGVIPVNISKTANCWCTLNMEGEFIYNPQSKSILYSLPNENGTIAVRNYVNGQENRYSLDKNGNILWHFESSDIVERYEGTTWFTNLWVSDANNLLFEKGSGGVTFLSENGDILFDGIGSVSSAYCFQFSDEVAVIIEQGAGRNQDNILLLYLDGSTEYVLQGIDASYIADGYSDGYFVYRDRNEYVFYNPETKDERRIPCHDGYAVEEYSGRNIGKSYSPLHSFDWNVGDGLPRGISTTFKRYYKNGNMLGHVATYACYTYGEIGTNVTFDKIDVLFDVARITEENPHGIVAIYDEIFFDNSKYLLVREGDKYFYIDFDGNVVSDTFYKATSFSEQGYAIVMPNPNQVYVIDEELKRVKKLEDITDVESQALGDIFVVYCNQDKYIYYYGE